MLSGLKICDVVKYVVLLLLLTRQVFCDIPEQRIVYGFDDRENTPDTASYSNAVAGLLLSRNFVNASVFPSASYRFGYIGTRACSLCTNERFYGEPQAPFCTGVLLAPDTLATARHCLQGLPNGKAFAVFGMTNGRMFSDGLEWREIHYNESRAVHADLSYVTLTPAMPEGIALPRGALPPVEGDMLSLVGHSMGLTMKTASNARVLRVDADGRRFTVAADAYVGNSGSPLIRIDTGEVFGILSTGNTDFLMNNGCCTSRVCSDLAGCRVVGSFTGEVAIVPPPL